MAANASGSATVRRSGRGGAPLGVVSEDPEVRERIVSLLCSEYTVLHSGEAATDPGAGSLDEGPPTALILCCRDERAGAAVQAVRERMPSARIVLVVGREGAARTLRLAVRMQVDAVVYRDQLEDALAPSVEAVLAGQVVFPRTERRRFQRGALSHRERQVLWMAADGLTNDEIGSRLHLATSTVKSHLTSAFSKLGVRSRNEAAEILSDPGGPVS
jgi:DNA-binding NarL/FixJ family response regulator